MEKNRLKNTVWIHLSTNVRKAFGNTKVCGKISPVPLVSGRICDLILAEDTRTSRVLMQHYGITTPMQSYHIFNEHQVVAGLVEKLQSGINIAIVTDAGTPGISDPGFLLVREAVKHDIEVECLPGPTAFDQEEFGISSLPHKRSRDFLICLQF